MHLQKLSSLVLVVFTSIVLVAPSVTSTDQPRHRGRAVAAPAPIQPHVADGGAPVPPVPPPIPNSNLTADGGAPVRPIPTPPMTAFVGV
jgi:hypothetical protein